MRTRGIAALCGTLLAIGVGLILRPSRPAPTVAKPTVGRQDRGVVADITEDPEKLRASLKREYPGIGDAQNLTIIGPDGTQTQFDAKGRPHRYPPGYVDKDNVTHLPNGESCPSPPD